jgi:FkbM family methyltransferase
MLDGLSYMARHYEQIIVLEDDCFPTYSAIEIFKNTLAEVEDDPAIYSVYGHHFETPTEGMSLSRFQGWGWATTRKKLIPVLSQLKAMFMMSETDYLAWTASVLTPEIVAKLDVTPGRDVVHVLQRQFSWDSATALLTAISGLSHRKTPQKVIYNCGLGADSGHFREDSNFLRKPPFNMVGAEEVWQYFGGPLSAERAEHKYFGLNELDRKIEEYIPQETGFFVEVGAYDGVNQSNTLSFERKGWRGLLIEPVPDTFEKCKKNRPLAKVVNAACVSFDYPGKEVGLIDVGLMSLVECARNNKEEKHAWIQRGEQLQQITSKSCLAPARTLTSIFEEQNLSEIDLLSVDVEGYKSEVLAGLDFSRFRPKHIVIEDSGTTDLESILGKYGYQIIAVLNERNFTRDLLFCDQQK